MPGVITDFADFSTSRDRNESRQPISVAKFDSVGALFDCATETEVSVVGCNVLVIVSVVNLPHILISVSWQIVLDAESCMGKVSRKDEG